MWLGEKERGIHFGGGAGIALAPNLGDLLAMYFVLLSVSL